MATGILEGAMPAAAASRLRAAGDKRKPYVRRTGPDRSQHLRRAFQWAFLLLNVWLGGEFYLWVRQFESGPTSASMARPAGVEGWLPIAGLMNLKYWLFTGQVPVFHPAAMFLLVSFLAIAFLFRKAFCSWLCPIGTISEYLWRAGRKLIKRGFRLPRWLDIPLRGLKYLMLGFFVWAISGMTAEAIASFMQGPYGVIADVKMLDFFRFLTWTGLAVIAGLVVSSVFVQNFWCRYLCPYGALLGLVSGLSPLRIRRNEPACIDCAKCAKACPAWLPVDRLRTVKSIECTGCLKCVAVCPAEGALEMSWSPVPAGRRKPLPLPAWAMALGIMVLFLGMVGFAKTAGYWKSRVPQSVYRQLIPAASEIEHPMPGR